MNLKRINHDACILKAALVLALSLQSGHAMDQSKLPIETDLSLTPPMITYSEYEVSLSEYMECIEHMVGIRTLSSNPSPRDPNLHNEINNSQRQHALTNPIEFLRLQSYRYKWLDLSNQNLGNEAIAVISPDFNVVFPELEDLDLKGNNITASGIQTLAPHLLKLKNLEKISFQNNLFGDEGLLIFASYISQLPKLNGIALKHNNITDGGIVAIIPFLPRKFMLDVGLTFIGNDAKDALRAAGFISPSTLWWYRK